MAEDATWLTDDEQRAWRAWLAMTELLRARVAHDLLAESGLSDADYMVLVFLSEHPERRMRMTELAGHLRWSRSRLSHQLDRMQTRGLVERDECPSDARGTMARLTDAGMEEIRRAAPRHVASVRRALFDVLDPVQVTQLRAIAEAVAAHL